MLIIMGAILWCSFSNRQSVMAMGDDDDDDDDAQIGPKVTFKNLLLKVLYFGIG